MEKDELQGKALKGKFAEVKIVLIAFFAGPALNKCWIVKTSCLGELSHCGYVHDIERFHSNGI
ncbi:hypothetical protein B1NLA3E_16960 [Bacillus sp. 1NLA3E]|nr:hypothetical protein B1NLA3E_16960 [Bacillus sp. 1NLA3E]